MANPTEPESTPLAVEQPAMDLPRHPSRLNQALAWVGIVAGGVFIVAAVFFSGFFLSWGIGGHHAAQGQVDCCSQMKADGQMAPGAMMGPGGPKAPSGQTMPGMTMDPGKGMGPGQQSTTAPPPSNPRP